MKSSNSNEIKRGQAISFRVPSDTPDHLMKQLQKLKETERRNFSSKVAEFVLQGVGLSSAKDRETITIPLPQRLSKSQRDWLKHEHSEALLGTIIYQLLLDPVRATALLASLNSNSLDINEALYLQEERNDFELTDVGVPPQVDGNLHSIEQLAAANESDSMDDLEAFDWDSAIQNQRSPADEEPVAEDDLDSLLGDFLNKMNK